MFPAGIIPPKLFQTQLQSQINMFISGVKSPLHCYSMMINGMTFISESFNDYY